VCVRALYVSNATGDRCAGAHARIDWRRRAPRAHSAHVDVWMSHVTPVARGFSNERVPRGKIESAARKLMQAITEAE